MKQFDKVICKGNPILSNSKDIDFNNREGFIFNKVIGSKVEVMCGRHYGVFETAKLDRKI